MAQLSDYLALVIPSHQNSPKFMAILSVFLQGHVDNQNVLASLPMLFTLEFAVGQQLDWVGAKVGQARESIAGVPVTDAVYRQVLLAVIAANHWDGTAPGAYAVWAIAFGPNQIMLQDLMDMSFRIIWIGPVLTSTIATLLTSGQLALKPATVRISGYFKTSVPGMRVFGLGPETATVGGLGDSCWMERI